MKVLLLTIYLNCNAKSGAKSTKKWPIQASVSETCLPAKGIPEGSGIFFAHSRHVEAIILLQRLER